MLYEVITLIDTDMAFPTIDQPGMPFGDLGRLILPVLVAAKAVSSTVGGVNIMRNQRWIAGRPRRGNQTAVARDGAGGGLTGGQGKEQASGQYGRQHRSPETVHDNLPLLNGLRKPKVRACSGQTPMQAPQRVQSPA